MDALQEIDQKDIAQVSNTFTELISNSLQNPQLLNTSVSFLEQSTLASNFSTPESRLSLINFFGKMDRHRESLEIERGNLNLDDLKQAAGRFGAKSQSAFKTEIG